MPPTNNNIQQLSQAVPFDFEQSTEPNFSSLFLDWVLPKDAVVPVWWSASRDLWLREYWKQSPAFSISVPTFVSKTLSIPFSIQAKDASIDRHVKMASRFTNALHDFSGTAARGPIKGFETAIQSFLIDYLTQDNGAFLFIMGGGSQAGPVVGMPLGLLHLDSSRCTRTSNPEFPVIYRHTSNGKTDTYKIHVTRLIEMAHLSSPEADKNGVGLSPVSCAISAAREIWNVYRHSEEKFGSRPPKQILYAKTGATVANLQAAIEHWQYRLDNAGRSHFGGTMIAAPAQANLQLELEMLDLASAPDGFERQEVFMQDLALVAAAFGLDLLDLAVAFGIQGQTRANADVQTKKGRGKGPGSFLEWFIKELNRRYLPDNLHAVADNVDDDQDQQRAEIANERSQSYARHIQFKIRDERSIRLDMLDNNQIDQTKFEELELSSGRLPDGISTISLFESKDPEYKAWLNLGIEDYTDVNGNDPDEIFAAIRRQRKEIYADIVDGATETTKKKAKRALSALKELENIYRASPLMQFQDDPSMDEQETADGVQSTNASSPPPPSGRAIERDELEGDEEDRETQRDQLPQDNQMKEKVTVRDPLGWLEEDIDPYSLSEQEIADAISAFDRSSRLEGILEAQTR